MSEKQAEGKSSLRTAVEQLPNPRMVQVAIDRSLESPCRSKRGVVIFRENLRIGSGFNHKPDGSCEGSAECKATCRREAVHAEQHALLRAGLHAQGCEALHVKTVNGQLVASGGPSCAQCSKLLLAAGVTAVWLYHDSGWRRYEASEFHRLSLESDVLALLPDEPETRLEKCPGCGDRVLRGGHPNCVVVHGPDCIGKAQAAGGERSAHSGEKEPRGTPEQGMTPSQEIEALKTELAEVRSQRDAARDQWIALETKAAGYRCTACDATSDSPTVPCEHGDRFVAKVINVKGGKEPEQE